MQFTFSENNNIHNVNDSSHYENYRSLYLQQPELHYLIKNSALDLFLFFGMILVRQMSSFV